MKAQSGFSTLEVMVAAVIVGVALVPILGLQTQLALGQARLAEIRTDSSAVGNTLALVRDLNPMVAPEGRRRLDEHTVVTWTSAAISAPMASTNPPGFVVQLYRVSAVIDRSDRAAATTLQIDVIGWRSADAQR